MNFGMLDTVGLFQIAGSIFAEILSVNLTKNTYRMIQYDHVTTINTPREGKMDDLINGRAPFVAEEDREAFLHCFSRERVLEAFEVQEKEKVELLYRRPGKDGKYHWLETIAVRQDNPYGDDVIAVAISRNMDSQKIEEERLRESLRIQQENARLKMNERILELVTEHSERNVIYYNLLTKKAKFWVNMDGIITKREFTVLEFLQSNDLPEESADAINAILSDIDQGSRGGKIRLLGKTLSNGKRRWIDLKYSTMYDDQEVPTAVLFSYADVTVYHEQEMNHLYYTRTLESNRGKVLFEASCNLTENVLESADGMDIPTNVDIRSMSQTAFNEQILAEEFFNENRKEAIHFLSRDYLLPEYEKGNAHLKQIWKMKKTGGGHRWVYTEITMVEDPYSGHIKGHLQLLDATDEYEEQMAIQHRSEHDSMTGLLNRGASEYRIRKAMKEKDGKGGILIMLDLDDLKGINDTLGHMYGDKAICGIASTLKTHFRSNDIIGRLGGDEFIIFLPKAAGSKGAISLSLSDLLEKLSRIFVGENKERHIQCSIGCAEQKSEADSFEQLYKQADVALYHVKRNGKNNFAFYELGMEQL